MTGPVVRAATRADLATVAEIWVKSWQAAYAGIVPAHHLDALDPQVRYPKLVERFVDPADPHEIFVVEGPGLVVGFVVIGPWRGEDAARELGEIGAIYLLPEHWGGGLGRLLLDRAEQRLGELGCAEVRLWVLQDNTRAQRFYRSAGWSADGGRQHYQVGGSSLPELRYARRLSRRGRSDG